MQFYAAVIKFVCITDQTCMEQRPIIGNSFEVEITVSGNCGANNYKDEKGWARMAMLNTACAGKFTSDRTIQEYVDDIWHLDKVFVK